MTLKINLQYEPKMENKPKLEDVTNNIVKPLSINNYQLT